MKMQKFFLSILTLLCLSSFSQPISKSTSNIPPIVHVFMGYVIKLNANAEGRFSYDILQQGKLVINQTRNPFNPSVSGLATIDDALKIAKWQVQQLAAGAPPSLSIMQRVPQAIARQLNITTE